MLRLRFRSLIALAGLLVVPAAAHAGVNVGLLADGVFTKPVISTTPAASSDPFASKFGYGGGVSFEVGLGGLGLEADALYLIHKYDINSGASTNTQTGLQVPVMLRLYLPVISLGAGAYYEKFLGNLNNTAAGDVDYATAGYGSSDIGLVGSVRFDLAGFLVEGRYTYGFINALTPSGVAAQIAANPGVTDLSIRNTSIQAIVGYRFGMGR